MRPIRLALVALAAPAAAQVQGPGLGNLTYDASELFQPVSVLVSQNGHGMTTMVNGYLLVPDVGDVNTTKALEFWDVSDPRQATRAYRHASTEIQALREAHAIALSTSYGGDHLALLADDGVQFWDVTDPSAISLVSYLVLPEIPPALYTGIWWLFWQAPWLYVAGTSAGLYVARVDDIATPEFVKVVPAGQLGGLVVHYAFALGNQLVLMTSIDPGFATFDVSDPANPVLRQKLQGPRGYSHIFAAGRVLTSGGDGGPVQMVVHDVTPSGLMSFVGSVGSGFSNGAYGAWQDGFFHSGMSDVYVKFDVEQMQVVGSATTGLAGRDEDFCQVLGNLAFVGDDHGIGSGLYVHDVQPDSRGPAVEAVNPPDGAQNVALTSRVGVSMSDSVAFESAGAGSFVVRPLGGAPLPGKHAVQMGLVNFCPDAALAPSTVYEVVVDGIQDLVGNSGPVFRSTFATGSLGNPPSTPVAVQNLAAASGKPYRSGALGVGELTYIDREYRFSAIPARLDGHTYVLTANNDKAGASPAWLTFDVAEPVEVDVLFDERATQLPAWLQSWTPTGETASGANGYDVYKREFPAGAVALGGNGNAPVLGAGSMYSVVVLPSQAPPTCAPPLVAAVETGAVATFQAVPLTGAPPFTYSWSFGDGSPPTASSGAPTATHAYARAGRYPVIVTVSNAQGSTAAAAVQIVHDPLTLPAPANAAPIVHDGARVSAVHPDGDTVAALDAVTLAKLWESPVGDHPRTLALAPSGELWVVCQDDATIHVLRASDGAQQGVLELARGSRPYAVAFRPDGLAAYVTLEAGAPLGSSLTPAPLSARSARGAFANGPSALFGPEVPLARLLELDPASGVVRRALALPGQARGLAAAHDSTRLFVSRFVSPHPARAGVVWEIDATSLRLVREHRLQFDPGPDTEESGRGVPNYLSALALSPDGERLLAPSKKDNTARGMYRSGEPLTFESRTRTIVSQLDLVAGAEDLAARLDLNDRDMAQAAAWSPRGDLFLVAAQGSNTVEVFDSASGSHLASLPVGRAPQGLVFAPDGSRLFVQNFLSRSVTVYETSALVAGLHYNPPRLADVVTQASEPLAPQVLAGKRVFYDASDRRMNLDGYIACASCHLDGGSDGQVWDFTQGGEGLRNTIPLVGRAGLGHGNVHWSANFDEIQDFENDVRGGFAGAGFMLAPDFQATAAPLGPPKAGLSSDLDALAAFVASLDAFPPSPFRRQDGALTDEALRGAALFASLGCATCHVPPAFTDGARHDVGTLRPSSGLGNGAPLAGVGFETPTLHGLWSTAPYLHDGQAATLQQVLNSAEHGGTDVLTPDERAALARYLLEIE